MTCESCGRWAPADRETGYDADTMCPECKAEWDAADRAEMESRRRDDTPEPPDAIDLEWTW